jgi:hypothetical protein
LSQIRIGGNLIRCFYRINILFTFDCYNDNLKTGTKGVDKEWTT